MNQRDREMTMAEVEDYALILSQRGIEFPVPSAEEMENMSARDLMSLRNRVKDIARTPN